MNKSEIGEITLLTVSLALRMQGKWVFHPVGGDTCRVDLIYMEEDGRLFRVQCKTGRLVKGAILFPTSSQHAASRTGLPKAIRRTYRGQIDSFGVFCPQTGTM